MKVDPKLGGQWKEKEKFPMFGGQWKEKEKFLMFRGQWKEKEKFPMLGGQRKEKEKLPFHLFPLAPQAIYLGLHPFLLTSQFYFTIVLGHYLHIPFFLSSAYKLQYAFRCHKSPTHLLSIWFG